MQKDKRYHQLKQIKDEIVRCKKCPLYQERVKNNFLPVIGEGSHYAKVMFIGEAPGLNEARTGRPFCGAAGRVLDELLALIRIKRQSVYITNVVKDRPPNNRDPNQEEIKAYAPFLRRQIEIIKPKIICPLGNYATNFIFNEFGLLGQIQGISRIHGQVFEARASYGQIKIIPLYHPAVAVYNINMKKVLIKDFQTVQKLIQ